MNSESGLCRLTLCSGACLVDRRLERQVQGRAAVRVLLVDVDPLLWLHPHFLLEVLAAFGAETGQAAEAAAALGDVRVRGEELTESTQVAVNHIERERGHQNLSRP